MKEPMLNFQYQNGYTALMKACAANNLVIVSYLLSHCAIINNKTEEYTSSSEIQYDRNPLIIACQKN